MSKNLNNNYSSDSTTNLQIASLQTSLATINTQISTLATTTYVDSSVNTSYLQSYSVGNSSISAAVTLNNTNYVLPLFNTYLSTILTTSLINSLISTNNTGYIASLLSSTLISQNTLRDTAISTAITSAKSTFLSSSNTYSATQIFSNITTSGINYIGSFNSVQIGQNCSAGVNSCAIGYGALTNSSGVSVGSNSMIVNSGVNNSIIGSNSMIYNTTGKSNVCIGQGCGTANITGNYNCFIGAETNTTGQYNNSCAIGYASMITQSNQIQLGTSSETIFLNKLSMSTTPILTYSSLPSLVSNQIGYQITNSRTIAIAFTSADSYINVTLATLPIGYYLITYSLNLYSTTTTSAVVEKSFIEYGISTTSTSNNLQNRKSYFSVPTALSHTLTNTFCYACSGLTIFLNANLTGLDLTNNSLTASRFYINNDANITATRIA